FIPAVSFYCINGSVYHTLHNPYVINTPVISPVKENKISRCGNIAAVHELTTALKPFHACRTQRKFRDNSRLNVSTLVRTPAYKTGIPFLPFCKSVPAPVGIASISFLRQRHLHNRLTSGSCRDTAKHVVSQYMRYILGISVTAPSVLLCHHRGKLHCIGIGVSSIILFRP